MQGTVLQDFRHQYKWNFTNATTKEWLTQQNIRYNLRYWICLLPLLLLLYTHTHTHTHTEFMSCAYRKYEMSHFIDCMRHRDFWRQILEKNCSIHIWSNYGPQGAESYRVVCLMVHIIWKAFCFKQGPTQVSLAFVFVLYWQYSAVTNTNKHDLALPESQCFHLA